MLKAKTRELPFFAKLPEEKQEKVFQAALQEFAEHGYNNASMNNLVKAAGISKGSLFQYFHTKHKLFDLVVDISADKVKKYLREVRDRSKGLPFPTRIEHLLRAGFKFIDEHPLLVRIYFRLLQSGEAPFGMEKVVLLREQANKFVIDIINAAYEKNEIRSDLEREKTAFLINSLLETVLRAYYTEFLAAGLGIYKGNSDQLELWIDAVSSLISNGVLRQQTQGDCKCD